ncbi:MAG TPA: c-type cytochrome [Methylophilaceae bacterium]|nr:c-type cytochrome [Methylophilaceae bacterium]
MQQIWAIIFLGFIILSPTAMAEQTASSASVPDTMEARVQACVICHGENGRGIENVYFPHLAGKPAGYLYHQLVAFRDGRRRYNPMNYLLAYLPDEYLQKMAEYYASQEFKPTHTPSTASAQVLKQGQKIVTQGIPSKQIPACTACHGPGLTGREPGIPSLLGLRADYISAQLGAWRYGTRTAIAPDCMQLVASRLSEQEVSAVAAWLASQEVPDTVRPLKADHTRLPLECGSQK